MIARNSSFTYKGKTVDIKQVGRELGVRYVLNGSVRRAGNRLRITGQLIDSITGTHIWADRYDGDISDIFVLQDKVALDVVGAVTPQLELTEIETSKHKPTENLGAYDYYLRGMARSYLGTREAIEECEQLILRAIELDPNFAAAHAMAAFCNGMLIGTGLRRDEQIVVATSRFARRAVELDRNDPVVLVRAAWSTAFVSQDLDAAAVYVQHALTLNINLALAWTASGYINLWLGNPELAIEHFTQAIKLSPLDPSMRLVLFGIAHAQLMAGRYEEAWAIAARGVLQWPTTVAFRIAAASAALAGRSHLAAKNMALLLEVDPGRTQSNLAQVLGPYRRKEDLERYKKGLRLAGLPK